MGVAQPSVVTPTVRITKLMPVTEDGYYCCYKVTEREIVNVSQVVHRLVTAYYGLLSPMPGLAQPYLLALSLKVFKPEFSPGCP